MGNIFLETPMDGRLVGSCVLTARDFEYTVNEITFHYVDAVNSCPMRSAMKESDFSPAAAADRERYVTRPYETVPITELVKGSNSHLVRGSNVMLSFLTMKAGSIFELHSHPEEQVMVVLDGYCDEIIEGKIYRVGPGDVLRLPPNVKHGAFLREVDCRVIDVFSPARRDYAEKFSEQNKGVPLRFA